MNMRLLLLRVHMYAGLLTVSNLIVYSIAGLYATVQPARPQPTPTSITYVPFVSAGSSSDEQVAEAVYRTLHLPLTFPLPKSALQRDVQQNLVLEYYTVNGTDRITVLEHEGRLRVERTHSTLLQFLNDLHTALPGDWEKPRLMRAWAYWNEFAAWCLVAFSLSGVVLWMMSRGVRWAAGILATGAASFAWLWWLLR